jgi:hypothetical protein
MQPETTYDLHPAGQFEGTIVDHGISEAKTGTPQVFLKIESSKGGRTIYAYLALTDNAVEFTVIKLRNAGFTGSSFAELEDGSLLKGNVIDYKVEHEVYNGQTRAKVGWIGDPNGGAKRSVEAAQNARRFDAALRANPALAQPATSRTSQPAIPPGPAPAADLADAGDIPF